MEDESSSSIDFSDEEHNRVSVSIPKGARYYENYGPRVGVFEEYLDENGETILTEEDLIVPIRSHGRYYEEPINANVYSIIGEKYEPTPGSGPKGILDLLNAYNKIMESKGITEAELLHNQNPQNRSNPKYKLGLNWFDLLKGLLPSGSSIINNIKSIILTRGARFAEGILISALLSLGGYTATKIYDYLFPGRPKKQIMAPSIPVEHIKTPLIPQYYYEIPEYYKGVAYEPPLQKRYFPIKDIPIMRQTDVKMLEHLFRKPKTHIDHSAYVKSKINDLIRQKVNMGY
jgi:hypothetical protein